MNLLPKLGPWLVALAPAYFVYATLTGASYNVPLIIAVAIAAGVELTGIEAYHTFTRLYGYNRAKRQKDPHAPTWLSVLAIAGYVIAGVILTAVLKSDWVLGLFFLLAAVGYVTIALNIDHDERERGISAAKAEAKKERAERPANVQRTSIVQPNVWERSPEFDELLTIVHEHSQGQPFGHADVQNWTRKKRTTAYNTIKYGEQLGVVQKVGRGQYVYKNGREY